MYEFRFAVERQIAQGVFSGGFPFGFVQLIFLAHFTKMFHLFSLMKYLMSFDSKFDILFLHHSRSMWINYNQISIFKPLVLTPSYSREQIGLDF